MGRLDLPDKYRDEDDYFPEIGSENYMRLHTEEVDRCVCRKGARCGRCIAQAGLITTKGKAHA